MSSSLAQALELCAKAEREAARLNHTGGTSEALQLAGLLVGYRHGGIPAYRLRAALDVLHWKVPDSFFRTLYHGDLLRAVTDALAAAPMEIAA